MRDSNQNPARKALIAPPVVREPADITRFSNSLESEGIGRLPLPTGWALLITISAAFAWPPIPTRGDRAQPAFCSRGLAPSHLLSSVIRPAIRGPGLCKMDGMGGQGANPAAGIQIPASKSAARLGLLPRSCCVSAFHAAAHRIHLARLLTAPLEPCRQPPPMPRCPSTGTGWFVDRWVDFRTV